MIGNAGLQLIKSFEGLRLSAYLCPAGKWTIGYGTTSGVYPGMNISKTQAEKMLLSDCEKYARYVDDPSYVPLTQSLNSNQRDALISFAYNCGAGNLKKLCKDRTLDQIADAILLYNKASGKVLEGLTRRRKAERELFCEPIQSTSKSEVPEMKTIKKGSKGKAVKIWQIILGYSGDDLDGIFGADTERDTIKLQKKLFPDDEKEWDGVVGSKTWAAGLSHAKVIK